MKSNEIVDEMLNNNNDVEHQNNNSAYLENLFR